MQHRRSQAGEFQHLVTADLGHQLGIGHLAWIRGQHTRHIGVDLAGVGAERRGKSNGRGVRSAAAQGGDLRDSAAAAAGALKPGHHHDGAVRQATLHPVGADLEDARTAVGGFGDDADLRAGHRHSAHPKSVQSHRQQCDRHLLAAGQQHVHLPSRRVGVDRCRQPGEFVGGVPHGGDHHDHVVAFLPAAGDALSHGLDALDAADGGAAELLHQQGHARDPSNAGVSHPSRPSRKASSGGDPRFSRASTSSRRPSRERNRLAGRPCSCLRIT